jgi:hypothetical protein
MRTIAILGLGLCGCLQTPAQAPVKAPERPAAAPAVTEPVATAEPVAPAQPAGPAEPEEVSEPLPNPDPAWSLAPADIVLQIDQEPTFAGVVVGDPFRPFGRVPEVTMYRDGTVMFVAKVDEFFGLFTYRLGDDRVAAELGRVRELGFARIPGHSSGCVIRLEGKMCGSDAPYVVLRAATSGGKLREIRNYAGWSQRHQEALDAIYQHVELLGTDTAKSADTRMYLPRTATLFVRALTKLEGHDPERLARAPAWPLAPELFDRVYAEERTAVEIDAAQAQQIITVSGTNMPRVVGLRHGDRGVLVSMIPWLPGADHTRAMKRAKREDETERRRDERDRAE